MTSRPFPSIIIRTRFFPMSCRSPCTVPRQTLPLIQSDFSARYGLNACAPRFMVLEATRTSGTKTSLFLNFSPIRLMPCSNPSSNIFCGSIPLSSASLISSLTALAFPHCKFSEISRRMESERFSFLICFVSDSAFCESRYWCGVTCINV